MSIKLELDDYCQECDRFDVAVRHNAYSTFDDNWIETLVTCEHIKQCRQMMKYIKEQIEKEKKTV